MRQTLPDSLLLLLTLSLIGCVSPTRDTSARPSSLEDHESALDGLVDRDAPATCGVSGLAAERGGLGGSLLRLDRAPGVVLAIEGRTIVVEMLPSGVIAEFAWPTPTAAQLFVVGEPVHLTRKTQWDSDAGSTMEIATITGRQTRAVFTSVHRALTERVANDPLTVATPLGALRMGDVECERAFAEGCAVEREERLATALDDGTLVTISSPLSRGEVIIDWARGSRVGAVTGCGGLSTGTIEESLEAAYFGPAPARREAPLADGRDYLDRI